MKTIVLILALATPALGQVYASLAPGITRYNDQYLGQNGLSNNGRSTDGDTRLCTQLVGGQIVCAINDGWGGQGVCSANGGENVFVQNVTSDYLSETTLNTFHDYGWATCQTNNNNTCGCNNVAGSWGDGKSWKSSGIFSDHGNLFLNVRRQLDSPPFGGANASLIMSQDSGLTWCNTSHVVSSACSGASSISGSTADVPSSGVQMWSTINNVYEVWYCKDNSVSCPSIDSNSTYSYLAMLPTSGGIYIARALQADLPKLDASLYTYWTGSTWGAFGSAASIMPTGFGFLQGIWYDSNLGYYIGVGYTEMNGGGPSTYSQLQIMSATTITGPWTFTQSVATNDLSFNFQGILPDTAVADGSCTTYTMLQGGSYNYALPAHPLQNNYSAQLQKIKFCASSVAVSTPTSQHNNSSVIQNGLYQEFNFAPRPDAVVFDSSGQGHNGTAYFHAGATPVAVSGPYTPQGIAGFDQRYTSTDFHVDTGLNYQGTNFTTTLVYIQQGPANAAPGYMKLLSNGTAFNVQGSFFIQRDSTTQDAFNSLVDQGGSSDFTMTDNSWNEVIIVRNGTTTKVYDSNSFNGGTVTPVQTFTSGSHALTGEIYIGGTIAGGNPFLSGQVGYYNFYNRALSEQELLRNQSVLMPRMARKGIALPHSNPGKLLDYQLPYGAWSLRKLSSTYSGNAINITRASDSTTLAVGFDGSGNLDNSAISTFCSGTSCTVNTLYDQSGHSYNAAITGGTIYQSGSLVTNGSQGRTAILGMTFGTGTNFFYQGIYGSGIAVTTIASGSPTYQSWVGWGDADPTKNCSNLVSEACTVIRNNNAAQLFFFRNSGNPTAQGITYGTPSVAAGSFGDYYWRFNVDGNSQVQTTVTGNTTNAPPRIYANSVFGGPGSLGYFFEAIFFPYQLTQSQYSILRLDQKAYYGTP